MRGLRFIILGVAVAAGVGAVALVKSELDRAKNQRPVVVAQKAAPPKRAQVLVAARELKMGELLNPEDLRWQPWPQDAVSEFYVTQENRPRAREDVEGVIVRSGLIAGEPITDTKLIRLAKPSVMAAFLRRGLRAVSIKVSPATIAGGFVLPGDYVDVILTANAEVENDNPEAGGSKRALVSETILTSVRVLAIDEAFRPGAAANTGKSRTATLEVSPEQAEVLALAEQGGSLRLALRSVAELIPEAGQRAIEPEPTLAFDPRLKPRDKEKEAELAQANLITVLRFTSKSDLTVEGGVVRAPAAVAEAAAAPTGAAPGGPNPSDPNPDLIGGGGGGGLSLAAPTSGAPAVDDADPEAGPQAGPSQEE